jgi:hypothetical protein
MIIMSLLSQLEDKKICAGRHAGVLLEEWESQQDGKFGNPGQRMSRDSPLRAQETYRNAACGES